MTSLWVQFGSEIEEFDMHPATFASYAAMRVAESCGLDCEDPRYEWHLIRTDDDGCAIIAQPEELVANLEGKVFELYQSTRVTDYA